MADRKISDLTALTAPAAGDYLPIVDISEASAANKNKRITIEELLRGAPDGTAAAPSIGFESDPNTGIYSPGADQVAVATNGVGRITIDGSGNVNIDSNTLYVDATNNRVGVGTSSPGARLDIARENNQLYISCNLGVPSFTYAERARTLQFSCSQLNTGDFTTFSDIVANSTQFNENVLRFFTHEIGVSAPQERLRITGTGRVGIGTTSPVFGVGDGLEVARSGVATVRVSSNTQGVELRSDAGTGTLETRGAFPLVLGTNATERARIDSSGRLLVGTSSGTNNVRVQENFGLVTTGSGNIGGMAITNYGGTGASARPLLDFQRSRGTTDGSFTAVASGDQLGSIIFRGADGSQFVNAAFINCEVDGTPGANDMPGRLVFSTTADGASSPTERLRITSAGVLQVADAGDIAVGTTTGTKIGTATTQKLGFYNATPVVQPTAVADATDAASVITQLNDLLAKLRTLGLIAT